MVDMTLLEESKFKKVLIYGPPKSGKTEAVGRLAEKYNLTYFDLENGRDTLFKLPEEWRKRINMVRIPDTRDFSMAAETCLKVIRGAPSTICWEHGKVSCPNCQDLKTKEPKEGAILTEVCLRDSGKEDIWVFDSLTQLTNSVIANITKNKPDDYKLEWDDWGRVGVIMDKFLSHVQNWERNIICISHENSVEMPDKSEKLVPVAGTRNFSRNSAKYFGEVVHAEVLNKKHRLASSTTYKNNVVTGSRAGKTLESSEDAKLLDLFE